MYLISVDGDFSSAHRLRGYQGKCRMLHGHNWKVRLTVRVGELDSRGMGLDFGHLKQHLAKVLQRFDHVDLNEVPPFDELNPTAENLARVIFELARAELPPGVTVDGVVLWESDRNRVEYRQG